MKRNEAHQILFERVERREEWKYNGEGELVQDTLYVCMELSQVKFPCIINVC
jgi:hypothetical protein